MGARMVTTTEDLVPGLRYVPGYLEEDTQNRLLAEVDAMPWHPISDQRRIQYYGYWSELARGGVYFIGELPRWANELSSRLLEDGLMPYPADQLIVSEYAPGQGIRPHVDAPVFAEVIVGISLGSTCIMEFTSAGERDEQLLLEPGSAIVLSGSARSAWQHAIPARREDVWQGRTLTRSRRISLTFRKMLEGDPIH